jgi:uncharacterized protein GlcG (DUF336 family)
MLKLTYDTSLNIAQEAVKKASKLGLNPLAIVVLDDRASLRICLNQDGTSIHRHRVAHGKANAAMSLGMGSRSLGSRAEEQAYFVDAVGRMMDGDFIPVPGGVLIRNSDGTILGAVGISGDISDNDEAVAIAAIESAGLVADTGS